MGGTWACQLKAPLKSPSSLGGEDLDCASCCFETEKMASEVLLVVRRRWQLLELW